MTEMNPWVPMSRPVEIKTVGKFLEELGEAVAAMSRCLIQGIDEREPVTGELNRVWLEDEIADVIGNAQLVIERFKLDEDRMAVRSHRKMQQLRKWHNMLVSGDEHAP